MGLDENILDSERNENNKIKFINSSVPLSQGEIFDQIDQVEAYKEFVSYRIKIWRQKQKELIAKRKEEARIRKEEERIKKESRAK